jgi:hypothetical protein
MNVAAATKNWKTTTLGIIGLVTLLATAAKALLDSDPTTNIDFSTFVPALMAAVAAIFAKDADVTGVPTP